MTNATQAANQQPQMGLTFQDVWAGFMELRARQAETNEQIRKNAEEHRKTEEMVSKMAANVDKMSAKVDEVSKNVGGVNNTLGKMVEYLITPSTMGRFRELGFTFNRLTRNEELVAPDGQSREVDVAMHNSEDILLIEVKAKPNDEDVNEHLERMRFIQANNIYPGKNIYGGIAGAVFAKSVKQYALRKGFYVLEQAGDTMHIETREGTFKGKKW